MSKPTHAIKLQPVEAIAPDVVDSTASFLSWYAKEQAISHPIIVYLLPAPCVRDEDEGDDAESAFSAIGIPNQSPDLEISEIPVFVGAEFPEVILEEYPDTPRSEAVFAMVENVAWELVHYERWRDGKEVSHRGAMVRSRNLVDKWLKAVAAE